MAGEVYIADKITLDDVHRMVKEIYNIDSLVTYTNRKATLPTTESTLLNITGAGYLVCISIYHNYTVSITAPMYFKVEIDGVVRYNITLSEVKAKGYLWGVKDWYDYISTPSEASLTYNEVFPSTGLKFNSSLKITGYVEGTSYGWHNYAYAYRLLES